MGSGSLMARHDQPDSQLPAQSLDGFHDHHVCPVCNPMDKAHAFGMQASDQKFSTGDF
jgi:hypothetical protein